MNDKLENKLSPITAQSGKVEEPKLEIKADKVEVATEGGFGAELVGSGASSAATSFPEGKSHNWQTD